MMIEKERSTSFGIHTLQFRSPMKKKPHIPFENNKLSFIGIQLSNIPH